jgi:hypothetical protein
MGDQGRSVSLAKIERYSRCCLDDDVEKPEDFDVQGWSEKKRGGRVCLALLNWASSNNVSTVVRGATNVLP